jgi:hypothetical protein
MLAVGPPMSLTTPLKSCGRRHMADLRRALIALAAALMMRPFVRVIEQNVQPPKHRMI